MTTINDLIRGGYWPLQHFDDDFDDELRILRFGARIEAEPTTRAISQITPGTTGPVVGGFMLDTLDLADLPRIWSFAAPVSCSKDEDELVSDAPAGGGGATSWRVVKGGAWSDLEQRLAPVEPAAPKGLRYPGGWPAAVLAGVDFRAQHEMLLPGFAGLVAPHAGGEQALGSPVWDVDDDGALDDERMARLQSLCRVYRYPTAGASTTSRVPDPAAPATATGGLAWQLGTARDGIAGDGMVADEAGSAAPKAGEPAASSTTTVERPQAGTTTTSAAPGGVGDQVLAAATVRKGGPFDVGEGGDQHQFATTPDGEPINSLHISTRAIFLGDGGDAPLLFEGPRLPEARAPLTVPAHLRYDANGRHETALGSFGGRWIFQAESFFAPVEPPPKEPPPFPPPPVPPRVPGGDGGLVGEGGLVTPGGVRVPSPAPPPGLVTPGSPLGEELLKIIAPEQRERDLVGSVGELAAPALVFRAQHFEPGQPDLRNLDAGAFGDEARRAWGLAPAVVRLEAAGAQLGGGDWDRTTEPGQGRYRAGGTSDGALWLMAPERGLELADVEGVATSTTALALWGVDLTFATPSAADPTTAINGYRITNTSTAFTQRLQIDSLDSAGANNHRIEIVGPNIITTGGMFQGDSLRLDDGSFYVTLEPEPSALTANRLAYIRDRTFYVGEHLVTNSISASGRIVTLRSYAVDCSGGAIALELPAATSANEGDEVEIIDATGSAAANNITINRVGSDTIRGSTSYVIGSDYGVVRLRCGSSTWHVVGEVIT